MLIPLRQSPPLVERGESRCREQAGHPARRQTAHGCGPKPAVASLIERFPMDHLNRMALFSMSSFVAASVCPKRSNFRTSFPLGQVRGGEMSPMAKGWTTNAGHTRCFRLLVTLPSFSEGETPEGTPQRLCPPSPVLSKHDAFSSTKSFGMLASRMQ